MISEFLNVATIPELIEYMKTQDITHSNLHLKATFTPDVSSLMINSSSILDRYVDFIKLNSSIIVFSDNDFRKYKFQPKKLSLVIYQTTELWSLLLKINNMASILEFTKNRILAPSAAVVFNLLNEIIILEKKQIEVNKAAQ
jgi:hypothetical protein